ncbi:degenerin-like protein del-10 [Tubulanus polymorphus]|uniref:degenerin-like protein del-10 n=1 Tax=Tubulanus polymorphus TaxID=672921 RepID=UPI003DA20FD8
MDNVLRIMDTSNGYEMKCLKCSTIITTGHCKHTSAAVAAAAAAAAAADGSYRKGSMDRVLLMNSDWKSILYNFTQNTTFHGVRYVCQTTDYLSRRLIWLALILIGTGIMLHQVIDRVVYYSSWPTTVKVDVNFNSTITFPVVAICNMNSFRVTESTRLGYYRALEQFYMSGTLNVTSSTANLTMQQILEQTGHRKEDMIVSCSWNGQPCGAANFTPIFTDHGLCYSFNNNIQQTSPLLVTEAGTEHGLRLVVNVEQYEYMYGPHDSAGLKVLLHDKKEVPLVYELGQGLSTATHTYIGIKLLVMTHLGEPYGICNHTQSRSFYYEKYSDSGCKMSCMMSVYEQVCGCRLSFMPHKHGFPRQCTLREQFECGSKAKDEFTRSEHTRCRCPVPCSMTIYEPSFSYSSTSYLDVDKLKRFVNTSGLLDKFTRARDIKSAVITKYAKKDIERIENLLAAGGVVYRILFVEMVRKLRRYAGRVKKTVSNLDVKFDDWNDIVRLQRDICDRLFYRGVLSIDRGSFAQVTLGNSEFEYRTDTYMKKLIESGINGYHRDMLKFELDTTIKSRRKVASEARRNAQSAYETFTTGKPLAKSNIEGVSVAMVTAAIPETTLNASVNRNHVISNRVRESIDRLGEMIDSYRELGQITDHAYKYGVVNTSRVREIHGKISVLSDEFNKDRDALLHDVYRYPTKVLDLKLKSIVERRVNFKKLHHQIEADIQILLTEINETKNSVWPVFTRLKETLMAYKSDPYIGWSVIARHTTSKEVDSFVIGLENLFQLIRSKSQTLSENCDKLLNISLSILQSAMSDTDSMTYFRSAAADRVLWVKQDFELLKRSVLSQFSDLDNGFDLNALLANHGNAFKTALTYMRDHHREYLAENKIGSTFYRENLLQVDIFYQKLSYELIQQQAAYDAYALLCDIGGSMGLFVGASVLTMFELLDVFAYQIFNKTKRKQKTTAL